jgi:hypothetical protein
MASENGATDELIALLSRRFEGRWELVAEDGGGRLLLKRLDAAREISAPALAQALETVFAALRPAGSDKLPVRAEGTATEFDEEAGLNDAARALARTAAQLGRAYALGPMSVQQRRSVHQALGEVPEVWTQSEGDGIQRRLWLVPRQVARKPEPAPRTSAPRGSGSPRE